MYLKSFFNYYFILIVCFQVGHLNGEATKKAEVPKGKQVLVIATTTEATDKLFDFGYPMNSMSPYLNPGGYGNLGNYYPNNNQYYPDNRNNNGWQNNPQNYPNQGNYPNGPYQSNFPNGQGNGYNQYPNQPIYTNRPGNQPMGNQPMGNQPMGNQPMGNQYPNQRPTNVGYQSAPNYNNRPIQGAGVDPASQNGYNNNQQNPSYQPSYPNGPNNYQGNNYPNNQGRPMQNNFPNQQGQTGINSGSPPYPNNNFNGPQHVDNNPRPNQGAPVQGEGSSQDNPNQNDQSNLRPDSGEYNGKPDQNIPNDTGIDDVAAILGKPVTVPQETTPSSSIIFPNTTESASKKQCVQDCHATTEYNPVCGTDNVTYVNPGKLVCARNCGIRVYLLQNGQCEEDSSLGTSFP